MRKDKQPVGRIWGPLTGRQLTVIACVAIVSIVLIIPTAALAASGAFTSTTSTPAVTGTNSGTVASATGVYGKATATGAGVVRFGVIGSAAGTSGIGVRGNGSAYGVFSNGPLGVAAGKPLVCTGCVGTNALSAAAKAPQPLNSGETESGTYAVDSPNGGTGGTGLLAPMSFTRPLAAPIADGNFIYVPPAGAPVTHCSGIGSADPGYVCIYAQEAFNTASFGPTSSSKFGATMIFSPSNGSTFQNALGVYTVTAP